MAHSHKLSALALTALILSGCSSNSEKTEAPAQEQLTDNVTSQQSKVTHTPDTTTKPQQVSDLWQLTRDNFQLDLTLDNERVQQQVKWYARHPQYLQRVANRASRYYHHILHEIIERGLPAELALLPVVESAYDPFAYSHGRAAGPWQFIPSTGKYFGLQQNWWFDERRDILSSTNAALNYLEKLNKRFDGDWLLALAAYNAGGGTVSRAIKKNTKAGKPTDFWSLPLPAETRKYVPKLLAISKLVQDPAAYNLTLAPLKNEPYFDVVETGGQLDLAQAAELAEISTKELYLLNPGFNRWATAPEGPHRLLVPVASAEKFRAGIAELPADQRMKWQRYTIQSGDALSTIARKYNTTVSQLKATNKLKSNRIRVGKTLLIPTSSGAAGEYVLTQNQRHQRAQQRIARNTDKQKQTHTVKSGESFWQIARSYDVGVRELARWNQMAPGDPLRIGHKLVVWTQPAAQLSPSQKQAIRKIGYRVRSGDSLYTIANKFRVSIGDISRWNQLNSSKYLQPGQQLTLYVDIRNAP